MSAKTGRTGLIAKKLGMTRLFNDDGSVKSPGYITALHNGVLIHNHFQLQGTTSFTEAPKYHKHADKEPLHIQFHGNPVKFRNIWLRENIEPLEGKKP